MRSFLYLSSILIIGSVSAIPGAQNYVAPSNSTRAVRQSEDPKNLEDVLAERQNDSEDVGPLGEVQLDVEEEDIGEVAQPKARVRRGYNRPAPQQKSKYGGGTASGQSNSKYGGNGAGSKYGGGQRPQQQQPQQQQQSQYGQQSSGGKYGGGRQQQNQGGNSGY